MSQTGQGKTSSVVERWAARPGRAVIFDFNGTLSDDEPILFQVFSGMFLEHLGWTLTSQDYFSHLAGRSDREIIETVLDDLHRADPDLVERLLAERRTRYFDLVAQRSPVLDETLGLVELLAEHRVPVGIVTGAQRADVDYVLAHRRMDSHFVTIVAEEDVTDGKPHPEGFLSAAGQMEVDPGSVLVFEDSLFGVRAAKAAGMDCIAVTGTHPAEGLAALADSVVDRLTPEILATVLAGTDLDA